MKAASKSLHASFPVHLLTQLIVGVCSKSRRLISTETQWPPRDEWSSSTQTKSSAQSKIPVSAALPRNPEEAKEHSSPRDRDLMCSSITCSARPLYAASTAEAITELEWVRMKMAKATEKEVWDTASFMIKDRLPTVTNLEKMLRSHAIEASVEQTKCNELTSKTRIGSMPIKNYETILAWKTSVLPIWFTVHTTLHCPFPPLAAHPIAHMKKRSRHFFCTAPYSLCQSVLPFWCAQRDLALPFEYKRELRH